MNKIQIINTTKSNKYSYRKVNILKKHNWKSSISKCDSIEKKCLLNIINKIKFSINIENYKLS